MPRPGGNPNLRDEAHKGAAARTEIGQFRVNLNKWKGGISSPSNPHMHKIPKEVQELYTWFKGLTKEDRDFLFELQGIYDILKANLLNGEIPKKVLNGEKLSRTELEQFKLLVDITEKHQKMKYGEKKININLSYKDVVDRMFSDDK